MAAGGPCRRAPRRPESAGSRPRRRPGGPAGARAADTEARAVVVLRYLDDISEREAAEVLGVSVGTVKSQCHLALRRLRENAPGLGALVGGLPLVRPGQPAEQADRRRDRRCHARAPRRDPDRLPRRRLRRDTRPGRLRLPADPLRGQRATRHQLPARRGLPEGAGGWRGRGRAPRGSRPGGRPGGLRRAARRRRGVGRGAGVPAGARPVHHRDGRARRLARRRDARVPRPDAARRRWPPDRLVARNYATEKVSTLARGPVPPGSGELSLAVGELQ